MKLNPFSKFTLTATTRIPLWIVAILSTSSLPASDPWPTEAERIAAYRERCEAVIQNVVETTDPQNPDRGGLFQIAVNLDAGENIEWARERLRAVNNPPKGSMFWMHPMVFVMYAGKEHLNAQDEAFIRELWRTYFPYRGDTENHWLMYYASLYLACQMYPDSGPEAWYNGKSAAENMQEAEAYIRDWIRITTSYGQGEYDSPNYIEEYIRPLALLYGWCEDKELQNLSRLMLDYVILDFAVENLNGLYGGAHSRLYPRYVLQPALTAATRHAWLLFGQGEFQNNGGNMILALSGYTPPAILQRVATDRDEAYVNKELKRTRWRLRNAGREAFEVDGKFTKPVYKYSYVHPDFILGSSQGGILQPIQQQTWSLIWKEDEPLGKSNTLFGIQPYSNPFEGTMYFGADWDTVTDLIARSKVDYDSPDKLEGGSPYEQVFQHESTLIALYDIPADSRFPHILTLFTRDLENRIEDESGWIFAKGGPVYIAYRPLAPGEWKPVDWTGLLKGGAGGWFSTNFEELSRGSEVLFSESLKNGYVLHVEPVDAFESYEEFQDNMKAMSLTFCLNPVPSVTLTTPDGTELHAEYGEIPSVNGNPVDYDNWPLYESPFAHADKGSMKLDIRHGGELYALDFINNKSTLSVEPGDESISHRPAPPKSTSSDGIIYPEDALFAAMIMTREQKASSVPTESGVLYRDPGTGDWHRIGPEIQMVSSATIDPGDPATLYLACGNGIVRTKDGGKTWRMITGWEESDVLKIVVDPENSRHIYAATAWGVIRSRDGGTTWEDANNGLPEYYAKGIVLDSDQPGRLLLATTTGLFESTDEAKSWRRVPSIPEVAVLRLKQSRADSRMWIAGTEGAGVWISKDGGNSWKQTDSGLSGSNVYGVAMHPTDPQQMAAGGWNTGVHVSTDGGRSWHRTETPLPSPNITSMLFDQNHPGRLWASTFEEGTFHTRDGGKSWSDANLFGAYVFDLGHF